MFLLCHPINWLTMKENYYCKQTWAKSGVALQTLLSFIHWFTDPVVPTALQLRHAPKVWDRSSSYKIDYVIVIQNFLNLEGNQSPIRFKNYCHINEVVDFAYWWSFSRGGSAPAACAADLALSIYGKARGCSTNTCVTHSFIN